MAYGDFGCEYPKCGNGRQVGSHFCSKHKKTPFRIPAEVRAYRRGQRDGRAEVIAAHAAICAAQVSSVAKEGK